MQPMKIPRIIKLKTIKEEYQYDGFRIPFRFEDEAKVWGISDERMAKMLEEAKPNIDPNAKPLKIIHTTTIG